MMLCDVKNEEPNYWF